MKKLWNRFDTAVIAAAVCVIFIAITFTVDYRIALAQTVCFAAVVCLKILHTKTVKEKLLYKVRAFSNQLSHEQGKAFETLTVACCMVNESGEIFWLNSSFKDRFSINADTPDINLKQLLKRDSMEKVLAGRGFHIKIDSDYFSIYSNELTDENGKFYLLYFFDETRLRLVEKEYYESRPSVMLTVIDNADEIYQNFKESDCAAIFSKIEQMIDDWASSYGGLCRKFSSARMMVLVEERGLSKMIADKFTILEKIRKFTFDDKPCEVTLSIGVGKESSLNESNNSARLALDMAQSRGGDQAAIKHEAQYKFYGGVSQGFEKKNKVRTRLIAKTIAQVVKESANVMVVGHRFSDFDSFGSAIGMQRIAKHFGVECKIVVDKKTTLALPLMQKFIDNGEENLFVSPQNAEQLIHDNTLVIVVDTHRKVFTECPEIVDKAGKVMVIDHHRKCVDFIDNTVVFYHLPNASSTCEMVTEIAQYVDTKQFIDPLCAQAMFAGIMLDTRYFVLRTGVRTFEAAAFLKGRNANTVEVKKLFSNDMGIFRMRNAVIDGAQTYRECCAISQSEAESANIRLVTSQAADEMLNIDGVKASFVLYRNADEINISARSFGEINVQLIMETLGGGGHQAMSACQLKDVSMQEARQKLEKAIDKYLDN